MKHNYLRNLFTTLLLMCCTVMSAQSYTYDYDFKVDGINYNILSEEDKTVEVASKFISSEMWNNYTGTVIIPENVTYNGTTYTVTEIGASAFYYAKYLDNVIIPKTVTKISGEAFGECGIQYIEIPNSVTIIEGAAFSRCSAVSITMSNSVTTIEDYLFYGCENLEYVKLPENLTYIGNNAFYECTGLKSIEIPNSVITIGSYAFYGCTGLKNVIIPNSVTSIMSAFSYCTELTEVTIGSGVAYMESEAFDACGNLTSITSLIPAEKLFAVSCFDIFHVGFMNDCTLYVPAGAKETYAATSGWNVFGNIVELTDENRQCGDNAHWDFEEATGTLIITGEGPMYDFSDNTAPWYKHNEAINNVIINDGITTIGNSAFKNCNYLTNITIGNSVTTIGNDAFSYCSSLKDITIGSGVTTIESRAFYNCDYIDSLNLNCNTIGNWFSGKSSIKKVVLGDNVRVIGDDAFYNCFELTNITIPNSVTTIGNSAFYNCYYLTNVTIGNSATTIGEHAFENCTRLKSITIPNSVTRIGSCAFVGCSSLKNITIPKNVTTIDSYTFGWCERLTSITIPNSVRTIGKSAFTSCDSLTSITIPNSVTTIGDEAFSCCSRLTSVTIGYSVNYIGYYTFDLCESLTSITSLIPAKKLSYVTLDYEAFNRVDKKKCTLYVPKGAKEKYAATIGWDEFRNIVEIEPTEVTITINQYGSATYCSPYTLDFSNVQGLKAYAATGYKSSTKVVTLIRVQTAGAGVGLFLKGEPGEYVVPIIESTDEHSLNMLVGTLEPTIVNSTDGGMTNFKYTIKSGDETPLFYQFEDNSTLSAGKAYLQIPTAWLPATAQKSVNICFDEGETTDIDEVDDENGESKTIYDLQGRIVKNPTSGIYIINGRKVFIK